MQEIEFLEEGVESGRDLGKAREVGQRGVGNVDFAEADGLELAQNARDLAAFAAGAPLSGQTRADPVSQQADAHSVNPPLYGFELLDGKFAKDLQEAATHRDLKLEVGKRVKSKIEVRRSGLRALVNGEELVHWSGDFGRFSMEAGTQLRDPGHLGLGSYKRTVIFHKAEVREILATGRKD